MKCFLCLTPYNIFNAIALLQETGEPADIILYDRHTNHNPQVFREQLEASGLFERVLFVDGDASDREKWLSGNFEFMRCCLRLCSKYEKILSEKDYDEFFIPFYNDYDLLLWKAAALHKVGRVTVYEEGEGTYVLPPIEPQWRGRSGKRLGIVLRDRDLEHVDSVRLYAPLMADPIVDNRIVSMPRVNEKRMREASAKVFGVDGSEIPYRGLFIGGGACPAQIEDEFVDMAAGEEFLNFAVKPHPKQVDEFRGRACRIVEGRQPLEAIFSAMPDIDDKVFIATKSTALVTPKTIYDKEPYLVILSDIPEIADVLEYRREWKHMIDVLITMYERPEKIFLPKTVDEAISVVHALLC